MILFLIPDLANNSISSVASVFNPRQLLVPVSSPPLQWEDSHGWGHGSSTGEPYMDVSPAWYELEREGLKAGRQSSGQWPLLVLYTLRGGTGFPLVGPADMSV